MPTTIKISDELFNIPTFGELTIKHLIDLRKINMDKPLEVLKWGLGKEPLLKDSKANQNQIKNTLALIYGLIKEITDWMQSDAKVYIPVSVELLGVNVTIKPDMMQNLPYWGSERTRSVINSITDGDYTDYIPEIIAHYLYSIVTKSMYDEDKADEFIEIVNEMKMTEAVQLGNFFLLKQLNLSKFSLGYWHIHLMRTRCRLASMFSTSTEQ